MFEYGVERWEYVCVSIAKDVSATFPLLLLLLLFSSFPSSFFSCSEGCSKFSISFFQHWGATDICSIYRRTYMGETKDCIMRAGSPSENNEHFDETLGKSIATVY
jgi:hypothetical protein